MPEENKSHLARAFSEDGALKTHVGGQALLEGIMMRGKYNWAIAVRQPDGSIYTEEHDLSSGKKKNKWMTWPLIRGCVGLVESLALGFKALTIASEHAYDAEGETYATLRAAKQAEQAEQAGQEKTSERKAPEQLSHAPQLDGAVAIAEHELASEAGAQFECAADAEQALQPERATALADTTVPADGIVPESPEEEQHESIMTGALLASSMVLGVVLAVVLFVVAPAFITNLIVGEYDQHTVLWNIVDGLLRVAIFIFYIWLIGRMSDIKRMFGYHGAEHKTIHCFEHSLPLTPENARSFPRLHVRCGTAFLIMVLIIAIIIYTCIPLNPLIGAWGVPDGAPKLLLVMAVRILFLPVIAGVSYEITVKWAGSHPESPLVKVILWPGMMMQYLTTNEPDDEMMECAIAAMQIVLKREEAEEGGRLG